MSETQGDEAIDDFLREILGSLENALSDNHEDDRTSTSNSRIHTRELGKDVRLQVGVKAIHNVLESPRKILAVNVVIHKLIDQGDRLLNLSERHGMPITKDITTFFNRKGSSWSFRTKNRITRRRIGANARSTTVSSGLKQEGLKLKLILVALSIGDSRLVLDEQGERRLHTEGLEMSFEVENHAFPLRCEVEEVVGILQIRRVVRRDL